MKTFRNLTLIGTSHIAQQSVDEVTRAVERLQPKIIAVELDQTRLYALLQKKKRKIKLSDIPKIGLKGYLFSLVGAYIQKKLGKMVGLAPGADMLTAINLAKKNKLKIGLVDQPIQITLKRLSQELTWKERFRFLVDLFKGIFFRKRELKKYGLEKMDLTKVPPEKLIKKMIGQVRQRYPSIYKVLIKERNEVLAKNLGALLKQEPEAPIVGVVGAGHEKEIVELIKKGFDKN